jgi:opacity protein-like surface antigen
MHSPRQFSIFCLALIASAITVALAAAQNPNPPPIVTLAPQTAADGSLPAISQVGQQGAYFQQAGSQDANCGQCQSDNCGRCSIRSVGLRNIGESLFPMGKPGCLEKYRSVYGGWSAVDDYNGENSASSTSGTFNDGFVLGTARGVYVCPNLRIELDSSWRNNTGENWTNGTATTPLDGQFNSYSSLLNVIREIGQFDKVTPYVGLGGGVSRQDGDLNLGAIDLETKDWAFAYQGIAGLKFQAFQQASLFVEYRYFGNSKTQIFSSTGGGPATNVGDYNYTAENVVFGIQFKR